MGIGQTVSIETIDQDAICEDLMQRLILRLASESPKAVASAISKRIFSKILGCVDESDWHGESFSENGKQYLKIYGLGIDYDVEFTFDGKVNIRITSAPSKEGVMFPLCRSFACPPPFETSNVEDARDFVNSSFSSFLDYSKSVLRSKLAVHKTINDGEKSVVMKNDDPKKVEAKKPVAKPVVKKVEAKKPVAKPVAKKVEAKKPVAKPVAKKVEAKKPVAKPVAKKVEAKKPVAKPVVKKVEAKKPVAKSVVKKVEAKKPVAKSVVKKVEAKKPVAKPVVKKVEAKKPVAKPVAKKPVAKPVAKKPVAKPVAKKVETKKPVAKSVAKKPGLKPSERRRDRFGRFAKERRRK